MSNLEDIIKDTIKDVNNFPKDGVVFKDITPILGIPELTGKIISAFKEKLENVNIDAIACVESRGFWFGTILAHTLQVPIIPIRKKGKLPGETVSTSYALEYGEETLELHRKTIIKGQNILIHDDLLATGGTCAATAKLVEEVGGKVTGFAFLVNLTFLNGSELLKPYSKDIISLAHY